MFPIGFIQGRLSPIVDGKIQAFPWKYWKKEFEIASRLGFSLIEWTLDQKNLYQNPLMTNNGQREVESLMQKHNISIPSLTGDCFMQSPFYKSKPNLRKTLIEDFQNIIKSCGFLNVEIIVFPLVDNGSIENKEQEDILLEVLGLVEPELIKYDIKIAFESDFPPKKLKSFITKLSSKYFGINYDIGNSAALNFNPKEEISFYGNRIINVHIKDRLLKGISVPLGDGNADLPSAFYYLNTINYKGNFILQTARSIEGNHSEVLCEYRDSVIRYLKNIN